MPLREPLRAESSAEQNNQLHPLEDCLRVMSFREPRTRQLPSLKSMANAVIGKHNSQDAIFMSSVKSEAIRHR